MRTLARLAMALKQRADVAVFGMGGGPQMRARRALTK